MSTTESIAFSHEQLSCFRDLSYDNNPLHWDQLYSRQTQFGRPIVQGICAVLYGLGKWGNGRKFRIASIQAQFKKPLYPDEIYDLNISEAGNQVTIRFLRGPSLRTEIVFTWSTFQNDEPGIPHHFSAGNVEYILNRSALPSFRTYFGIDQSQMPFEQLNGLLWSSYFVGMETPGKQALFTGCKFTFNESWNGDSPGELKIAVDERFNEVTVQGRGPGITSFLIHAFRRPLPVSYNIAEILSEVGKSENYKGKTVFISGASRGFGAVLAKAYSLQSATVILNYRSCKDEVENVLSEITANHGRAVILKGDVANASDCREMSEFIEREFGFIDALVNNAYPHIDYELFLEKSPEDFMSFLRDSFAMTYQLTHHLLPRINLGGTIINISTAYTQMPSRGFSHYVASKEAVEGLTRALAAEFADFKFIIARPPRMKTDQTNLPYDRTPSISPIPVARKLLRSLANLSGKQNLFEVDLDPGTE